MKKLIFTLLALVTLAGTACAEINNALPAPSWRYKMTVTVETPEGLKTGSAVREVWVEKAPPNTSASFNHNHVKGEAVAVDLGKRGVLFAVMRDGLRGPDAGWAIVYNALPFTDPQGNGSQGMTTDEIIDHYSHLKSAKAVLTPEQYPVMVRFKDPQDPKTVEAVYTAEHHDARDAEGGYLGQKFRITDHVEDAFGKGVKIKEVMIEMAQEPVTTGVSWSPLICWHSA